MHIRSVPLANHAPAAWFSALIAIIALVSITAAAERAVTAAQATGTWSDGTSEIKILALGGGS